MTAPRRIALWFLVLVYGAGAAAGWLAPSGYAMQFRETPSAPPSREFPLGTDALGRDLWARLLYGSRVSLVLAPAAALLATALAAALGIAAGFAGGFWEAAILRAADLFLSLPWLFLLLAVRALLPLNAAPLASVLITFLLLGLLGWAAPARVVAAAARSLRASDFLLQARAAGCPPLARLARHALPNLRPVLAAQFWTSVPVFILAEANLGFLGLGVSEPLPSWGGLLRELENLAAVETNPWMAAPLLLLLLVVGCFHLLAPAEEFAR
jgi:ABC-type dipeptide/oligopeptide/nickel transport system permease subunit